MTIISSKLNISIIVASHFKTLKTSDGKLLLSDYFTFIGVPLILAFLSIFFAFSISERLSGLLVNFGAIFTALLLSVLVLVYDQESKISLSDDPDSIKATKKRLLKELYHNISFSILCAVGLVFACVIQSVTDGVCWNFFSHYRLDWSTHILTPLIIVITANLFLNIIMIVKRMHALLASGSA